MNEKANYANVHRWLSYYHGKADHCENTKCKKLSEFFQWSLKKGFQYKKKRINFQKLCAVCHRVYDWTEQRDKNMSKAKMNVPIKIKKEDVRYVIESYKNYKWGMNKRLSDELKVTKQHICWIIRNKTRLLCE